MKNVLGEPDPGTNLQRLELPATGFPGDRPGSPLRRDSIGFLYPQPGGHRHLHGMDGGSPPAGQGAVSGGLGPGGHRQAAAVPGPRDRFGQRQRLCQPDPDGILCWPWNRVHPLQGLPQERPGMDRAEERFGSPPVRRPRTLLGPDRWTDDGSPVQRR